MKIITSGQILNNKSSGRYPLKYISVSYVWHQNEVREELEQKIEYQCSIIEIQKKQDYSLWLDYKSNVSDQWGTKEEAISNMAVIYGKSSVTLAIVPEIIRLLERANINNFDHQYLSSDLVKEFLIELYSSEWFKRAWTFQEQIVSNEIVIVSREAVMDITEAVRALLELSSRGEDYDSLIERLMNLNKVPGGIRNKESFLNKSYWDRAIIKVGFESLGGRPDEDDFNTIVKKAKAGCLTLIQALNLTCNRVAGKENKGFEPILGLISNNLQVYDGERLLLKVFLSETKRSTQENMCWLPVHMQYTNKNHELDKMKVEVTENGCLMLYAKAGNVIIDTKLRTMKVLYDLGQITYSVNLMYVGGTEETGILSHLDRIDKIITVEPLYKVRKERRFYIFKQPQGIKVLIGMKRVSSFLKEYREKEMVVLYPCSHFLSQ